MSVNAVSTQTGVTQTRELETKPKAKEQKEVSFWSKEWTAGNFFRDKIGWDSLADWLDDKDKVCTDGKDDGKLSFGETVKSFGKGLAGLVKGVLNHPIATAVSVGVGAAAVALTGGAILPVMVAAGATIGAGMIGVGAYKAATADTDAEAKQAWETIGTGTFSLGASALGAKKALTIADEAGVTSAQGAKNLSIGKALAQNFKSTPEALKVTVTNAKANVLTMSTGIVHPHSNELKYAHKYSIKGSEQTGSFKVLPEGTKIQTVDGIRTIQTGEVVAIDGSGNLYITTPKNIATNASNLSLHAQRDLYSTLGYKRYTDTRIRMFGDPWDDHYAYLYFKEGGKDSDCIRIFSRRGYLTEYDYYNAINSGHVDGDFYR